MGVLIGGNDMHTDFGMILTNLSLEMPEVKTKYQTLPLENGSIDLSEVVTGRPVYGLRTLKPTFKRRGASKHRSGFQCARRSRLRCMANACRLRCPMTRTIIIWVVSPVRRVRRNTVRARLRSQRCVTHTNTRRPKARRCAARARRRF